MSEETEKAQSEQAKILYGLTGKYTMNAGDECQVSGFMLDDGGVQWDFTRHGRVHSVRLSKKGMNAVVALWTELCWMEPPASAGEKHVQD